MARPFRSRLAISSCHVGRNDYDARRPRSARAVLPWPCAQALEKRFCELFEERRDGECDKAKRDRSERNGQEKQQSRNAVLLGELARIHRDPGDRPVGGVRCEEAEPEQNHAGGESGDGARAQDMSNSQLRCLPVGIAAAIEQIGGNQCDEGQCKTLPPSR